MNAVAPTKRVALLGAGYIADWHAKAIRSIPGLALAAVCDRVVARAQSLAAGFGNPPVFDSLDKLLAAGQIDAVHVLLPPEHHFAAAREILAAGINVFIEKPMCLESAQCQELIDLAREKNRRVGVNHNFLFAEPYEQLRRDVATGVLGRSDHVTINWFRELPQIAAGPFDGWLFRDSRNVLFEIGPHVAAHVIDLFGFPETVDVRPGNPIELPNGATFYRRWQICAIAQNTAIDVNLSFVPGFDEQTIAVRGSIGGATCDVGRNIYVRRLHTARGEDFDRYAVLRHEAAALKHQARRNLARYVLSKFKLSKRGNAYGHTIRSAIAAFYESSPTDPRIDGETGKSVIRLCEQFASTPDNRHPEGSEGSGIDPPSLDPSPVAARSFGVPQDDGARAALPKILLLGATGFIGKELLRQLTAAGHAVRVLVRNRSRLPVALQFPLVEIHEGDAADETDLDTALAGVTHVYHLARPVVKTWADYQRHDVDVTRLIAERCLAAGVKRLIYTGTIDSYYAGRRAGTITEDTPLDPHIERRNLYARSKAYCEALLTTLHRERHLPLVIVRPGIVIGRGGSPFHWGVGMWHHNAVCQTWGRGDNPLPLVLVEDVARAMVNLLDTPSIEGQSFNLVGDPLLSAQDYLAQLQKAANIKLQIHPTPIARFYLADLFKWLVKVLVRHPDRRRPSYRDWESRTQRARFDNAKAKRLLNWRPTADRADLIENGITQPTREFLK